MGCADLPSVDILDKEAKAENNTIIISWRVFNDNSIPLYLLNINNPVVTTDKDILYMNFVMVDTSGSLTLREIPFRSRVKRIGANEIYDFQFVIEPSHPFETQEFGEPVMIVPLVGFSEISISLGYTYEDIYFVNTLEGERELTGGEALKVKVDGRVMDVREVRRETLQTINSENYITVFDTQKAKKFKIDID